MRSHLIVNLLVLILGIQLVVGFHAPLFKHKRQPIGVNPKFVNKQYNQKFAGNRPVNQDVLGYKVSIGVGTPAQNFNLVVDTNLAETWIANINCDNTDPGDTCAGCLPPCHSYGCFGCCYKSAFIDTTCPAHILFNPSASSTYSSSNVSWIGNDKLSGILGNDQVTLGDEIVIQKATFVQITYLDWTTFNTYDLGDVSGKLGLGLQGLSSTHTPSLFEDAVQSDAAQDSKIGIWLKDSSSSRTTDAVGGISFGQIDQEKCPGRLTTLPLAGSNWSFQLTGTSVGEFNIDQAWTAEIALNNQWIEVPYELNEKILTATDAEYNYDVGAYSAQWLAFKLKDSIIN
ncbi:putative aspartyle protease [Aphelenchoides besseyi]|nr:putative aspartyle protease [Aphelenchoides besseyi]